MGHTCGTQSELACGDGCRFFASMALSGSRYSDEDCTGEYVSVEAVANSMVNAHNHGWVTRREWIVKHYEYVKDLEAALNKADKEICDTPCEYLEKLEKAQKDAVKERFEVEEDLRDAKKELDKQKRSHRTDHTYVTLVTTKVQHTKRTRRRHYTIAVGQQRGRCKHGT